jgi:hypothetical protein
MKDRPRGKGLWARNDRDLAAGRWVSTTSMIDGDLPAFLGYEVDETTRERMHAVSREYSKEPDRDHEPDSVRKARIVSETPSILRAVERLQPRRSELLEWSVPAESRR